MRSVTESRSPVNRLLLCLLLSLHYVSALRSRSNSTLLVRPIPEASMVILYYSLSVVVAVDVEQVL